MRALLLVSLSLVVSSCTGSNATCTTDDDCSEGFLCVASEDDRVCAAACAADTPCEKGEACIALDGVLEGACLEISGDLEDGSGCRADAECKSGACIDAEDERVCATLCDIAAPSCVDGARCVLDGLRYVCATPTDDVPVGGKCDAALDCVSGVCITPPGNAASQCATACETDDACTADETCVRLELGGRACLVLGLDGASCEVNGECDGGFCVRDVDDNKKCASGCDDGACALGFSCLRDDADHEVCLPALDDRAEGDDCDNDRQCASGLCRHYVDAADNDLGTLCSLPCADATPRCPDSQVCWEADDVDVCGPLPQG